jgi:MinD-like ATPase involved in chromosome partitioning or flagellar assembly/tetratricopeptide (TPR) repeat protein
MIEASYQTGRIITFYSYKGGTGRTMALANCACLLARGAWKPEREEGRAKVLVVDWDLEAPGLHRYFPEIEQPTAGVIDLFRTLAEQEDWKPKDNIGNRERAMSFFRSLDWRPFLHDTKVPGLQVLPAGAVDDDRYSARVNEFSWRALFQRTAGLFPAFAEYLASKYDYVLIDSRTGITDVSGICEMILPERLVVVFTANRQSLTGLDRLLREAIQYRRQSRDFRPLAIFPLPSRIESAKEELLRQWRGTPTRPGYQQQFENTFREVFGLEGCSLQNYFDEVQLQHVPDYTFGEPLPVELETSNSRLTLRRSYQAFTERLVSLSVPWESLAAVGWRREIERLLGVAERNMVSRDFDAGAKAFERVLAVQAEHPETDVPELAPALARGASTLMAASRLGPAAVLLRGIVGVARLKSGEGDPAVAIALWRVAEVEANLGRIGAALADADAARKIERAHLPEESPAARQGALRMAMLFLRAGRLADARGVLEPLTSLDLKGVRDEVTGHALALRVGIQSLSDGDRASIDLVRNIEQIDDRRGRAYALRAAGLEALARRSMAEARGLLERAMTHVGDGSSDPLRAACREDLAKIAAREGAREKSDLLCKQASREYEALSGPASPGVLRTRAIRAICSLRSNALEPAIAACDATVRDADRLGAEHPVHALLWATLALSHRLLGALPLGGEYEVKARRLASKWDRRFELDDGLELLERLEALDFEVLPDGPPSAAPAAIDSASQLLVVQPAAPSIAVASPAVPRPRSLGRARGVGAAVFGAVVASTFSVGVYRHWHLPATSPDWTAFVASANVHLKAGDFRRAVEDYSAAIIIDPTRADLYSGRAIALADSGNVLEAYVDVKKAQKLGGTEVADQLRPLLGDLLVRMGKPDAAVREYAAVPASSPLKETSLLMAARLRWQNGDRLGATSDYQQIIESPGAHPEHLDEARRRVSLAFLETPPLQDGETDVGRAALLIAMDQLRNGVREDAARPNRGKEIDAYNRSVGAPLGAPWGLSFVLWCLNGGASKTKTRVFRATSSLDEVTAEARARGWLYRGSEGKMAPGDVFLSPPNDVSPDGRAAQVAFVHHMSGDRAFVIAGDATPDDPGPDRVAGRVRTIDETTTYLRIPERKDLHDHK